MFKYATYDQFGRPAFPPISLLRCPAIGGFCLQSIEILLILRPVSMSLKSLALVFCREILVVSGKGGLNPTYLYVQFHCNLTHTRHLYTYTPHTYTIFPPTRDINSKQNSTITKYRAKLRYRHLSTSHDIIIYLAVSPEQRRSFVMQAVHPNDASRLTKSIQRL